MTTHSGGGGTARRPAGPADAAGPDGAPETKSSDVAWVDRLDERIRRRLAERDALDAAVEATIAAERRASLVHLRRLAVRRAGQVLLFLRDVCGGVAGRPAPAPELPDAETADVTADGAAGHESYVDRLVRRLRGRVVLYRLQRIDDGFLTRTALVCDVVDLPRYLRGSSVRLSAIAVGRFDRTRTFLHGTDGTKCGIRCRAIRRPEGDIFVIRDAFGHRLPPLLPDTALLLLAHHRADESQFGWAAVIRRVVLKAASTNVLLDWNGDLLRRVRELTADASRS